MSFLSVEYFNSFFGNYYMILSTPHSPPWYVFGYSLLLLVFFYWLVVVEAEPAAGC
jgi:amino acid transporter